MSGKINIPVFTELDEERYKIWFERLEKSYKAYVVAEEQNDVNLLNSIKATVNNELENFPAWITSQKAVSAGRIASSSNEMKLFLRHVAFPHVLTSYGKVLDEICPPDVLVQEAPVNVASDLNDHEGLSVVSSADCGAKQVSSSSSRAVLNADLAKPSATGTTSETDCAASSAVNVGPVSTPGASLSITSAPVSAQVQTTASAASEPGPVPSNKVPKSTLQLPMHIAPICTQPNNPDSTVEIFFKGLVSGQGDSVVNLCKLADITHRIHRAEEHDTHQVAHWIENEKSRRQGNEQCLARREQRLVALRGEDEEKLVEKSVTKLKSEVGTLNNRLAEAVMAEDAAKKAYEAAVMRRKAASQDISNLENYIDSVGIQKELLAKVNHLRLEADKYNISSAEKRVETFQGLEKYVHSVREQFVQRRLSEEMPVLFANIAALFSQLSLTQNNEKNTVAPATLVPVNTSDTTAVSAIDHANNNSINSISCSSSNTSNLDLYCAARVGLETIRIWKQLNLHVAQPSMVSPIEEFQRALAATLSHQPVPSINDASTEGIYRASDSTVVLFFDHLQHETPEDHVEAQSRVLTCLKMLTQHLTDDPPVAESPVMEVDTKGDDHLHGTGSSGVNGLASKKKPRSMQLLNCNEILAPPVWCLPLAHSPQYLAQLWRLAEEAHDWDLYVPLEFDTEWISEDPYLSNEDDDLPRNLRTPAIMNNLLKSVDFEEPWNHTLDEAQRDAFTQLLTPAPTDHLVAKVIKSMEQRAAAKAIRGQKLTGWSRTRGGGGSEERLPASSSKAECSGVSVMTPMGEGTVSNDYRRDGIVSVSLQWGAVGHFKRECVDFPAPVESNSSSGQGVKSERSSYSAAQSFYVSGSAGRFVHHDMELHNTISRLVSQVRVQKIIGDFVQINHANLSLYMHGRTSCGLTKSIEGSIIKYLQKFEDSKLTELLDEAEAASARGAPYEPQAFIKQLRSITVPPGQVGFVRTEDSTSALARDTMRVAASDTPVGSPAPVDRTGQNKPKGAGRGGSSAKEKSKSVANAVSAIVAESPAKPKQERTKIPTDVRSLPNYTPDGEILRELMSSIMKTLRMSQASISNEYYQYYRYETSQGGVSTWFHFRGNTTTFEGMNHCALMWCEEKKKYLSEEDQRRLSVVSKRMSQNSPSTGHSEHSSTHVVEDSAGTEHLQANHVGVKEEKMDVVNEIQNFAAVVNHDVSANTPSDAFASEMIHSTKEDMQLDQPSPAKFTTNEMQVVDHTGQYESVAVTGSSCSSVVRNEVSDDLGQPASTENAYISSSSSEVDAKDVIHSGARDDGDDEEEEEEEEDDEKCGDVGSYENEGDDDDDDDDDGDNEEEEDEEGDEESDDIRGGSGMNAPATTVASIVLEADTGIAGACNNNGTASPFEDTTHSSIATGPMENIRTVMDLHSAVVYEMSRRKVSQSRAAVEANLRDMGMGQPALSKFLSIASINNNERGKQFSSAMFNWIKYSRTQASTEGWDPKSATSFRFPPRPKPTNSTSGSASNKSWASSASSHKSSSQQRNGGEEDGSEYVDDHSLISDRSRSDSVSVKKESISKSAGPKPAKNSTSSKNELEELICGLCGKLSSDFANHKSFNMHLAWCYRRKANRPVDPPLKLGGNVVAWDPTGNRKRKAASAAPVRAEETAKRPRPSDVSYGMSSRPSMGSNNVEVPKDSYVVNADSFLPGFHYDTCETCHEPGDVILCDSCPCIYHIHCAGINEVPEGQWFCSKCMESGASVSEKLSDDKKNDPSLVDSWVLIYSDTLHRWRKAVVLAVHPDRKGVILAKWWRSDNKGGKSNWVDVSNAQILSASPERVSASSSRPRDFSNRGHNVRFDASEKKGLASARFRESHSMNFMDGENGGSVPPLERASAAGIGGVAALRDGEYADQKSSTNISGAGMSDTYISKNSLKAALCAAGSACRAVDIAICNENTNVFACTRPPGHHAGRYGCTSGCLSTGFCMLNNAAIAAIYARVRWGLERVAVVDIDVHFGNGTAELLRNDPNAFFASVHMIYGEDNDGLKTESSKRIKPNHEDAEKIKKTRAAESLGFYPARMGLTEVTDTYVSVGVYPTSEVRLNPDGAPRRRRKTSSAANDGCDACGSEDELLYGDNYPGCENEFMDTQDDANTSGLPNGADGASNPPSNLSSPMKPAGRKAPEAAARKAFVGSSGFLKALEDVIIPQMEKFRPQLLVISAGFDGYVSDPLGGQLCLSLDDYKVATKMLMSSMDRMRAQEPDQSVITGKVISLLEGGYDTSPFTLGLAKCVDAHVIALQEG